MPARPSDTFAEWNRGIPAMDSAAVAGSDLSTAIDAVLGIFTGNPRANVSPFSREALADVAQHIVPAWHRSAFHAE